MLNNEHNETENARTKGRYPDKGYTTLRKEELPELTEDELHQAAAPYAIGYFSDFIKKEHVGKTNYFEERGFALQNAGGGVLRCIYVIDLEYAIVLLAIAQESIRLAGGVLELAPFTIVKPLHLPLDATPETDASPSTLVGMEVA